MTTPDVYQKVVEAHLTEHPARVKGCKTCTAVAAVGRHQVAEVEAIRQRIEAAKPVKVDYTREELIELCEAAIVPMDNWHNRYSASAMRQIGDAWALLKAGVPFRVYPAKIDEDDTPARAGDLRTDHDTIWVHHYGIKGFNRFEYGDNTGPHPSGYGEGDNTDTEDSYIPTRKRLEERKDDDWY